MASRSSCRITASPPSAAAASGLGVNNPDGPASRQAIVPSAGVEFFLRNGNGATTITNNGSGQFANGVSTAPVDLADGDPIQIIIAYDQPEPSAYRGDDRPDHQRYLHPQSLIRHSGYHWPDRFRRLHRATTGGGLRQPHPHFPTSASTRPSPNRHRSGCCSSGLRCLQRAAVGHSSIFGFPPTVKRAKLFARHICGYPALSQNIKWITQNSMAFSRTLGILFSSGCPALCASAVLVISDAERRKNVKGFQVRSARHCCGGVCFHGAQYVRHVAGESDHRSGL